jgi:ParB/RepB/Spo0J family partition protein
MVEQLIFEGAPMATGTKVTIQKISLNKIRLNKNSRLNIDPEELDGLMQSIKEEGLLQPIGVVKSGTDYEICYGNRRFLAVSKLGMTHIPVIVHEKKKESDVDIKNLTENIQRRNISLAEIGRYIDILNSQGLSAAEVAVRLGVTKSYVTACLSAYREVPKEFKDDLEVRVVNGKAGSTKTRPGKISVRVARDIINARKTLNLSAEDTKTLFRAAKSDDRFSANKIQQYATALSRGKTDFLIAVEPEDMIQLTFFITKKHRRELEEKFVDDGPFKSVQQLMLSVLRGEKHVKIAVRK